ncbi:transposable element Tcb2 transposase [Trichonephila clavipes]|nr:transposable element Tcb2 transposase [Trichonephila clavipes]
MPQRSHLTDSEAWRVVGRNWNRFLETGSTGRRPGQGRRLAITPNEDRYLVLTDLRHRNMNATLLQQHLRSATGTTVSIHIIRNRLYGVGLYARQLISRGSVYPDNRRIFIWRGRCSRNNPAFAHESVRFGGGGVLVDEILRPIVVPYAAAIGDDFLLMGDNCRPHRANLVEDSLFEEGIVRMEWPACSPDMNPIEHVWDALGRRVAGRQPPPQTLQEQERDLLEEWDRIPQLGINSLIDSMPQSVAHPVEWLATLTALPLGLGSNPGEVMDVCKCIVPSRHGGTLNSRCNVTSRKQQQHLVSVSL